VLPLRSDLLTPIFKAFTVLGTPAFFFLFLPLGYWVADKLLFARVGLLLMLSAILNAYLKVLLRDPRPPETLWLVDVGESFGFPSGHSQIAVVVWLWIAASVGHRGLRLACVVVTAGVCFSRLYLGVHDLGDVLGGIAIGAMTLAAMRLAISERGRFRHAASPLVQLTAQVVLVILAALTWPGDGFPSVIPVGCVLVGFWGGVLVERRWIDFESSDRPVLRLLTVIAGLLLLAVVGGGSRAVELIAAGELPWWGALQLAAVGAVMSAGGPYLFKRLGLGASS